MFGCLAFASTIAAYRTKFHLHACMSVFLGYPPEVNGYQLYDIATKESFISRDVVFHEGFFYFQSLNIKPPVMDPFTNFVLNTSQATAPTTFSYNFPMAPPLASPPASTPPSVASELPLATNPISTPSQSPTPTIPPSLEIRRSTRLTTRPKYLHDFPCGQLISSGPKSAMSPHSLSHVLSYDLLSPSHQAFALSVSMHYEPQYYHHVVKLEH